MELKSDFSVLTIEVKDVVPFSAFAAAMKGKMYGEGPLTSAWLWFLDGWRAAEKSRLGL